MKLVFATNNNNKIEEINKLLPLNLDVLSLKDIHCFDDIEETAPTLEGNALLKANYVYENFGYPAFADDTGLFVKSLNGEPGVYSARYAGVPSNAEQNMAKLLNHMSDKTNREAYFKTVIALKTKDQEILFEGVCHGEILIEKTGQQGFGYDPIFRPKGHDQSFAEMELSLKNKISHRAIAIGKLTDYLSNL